MAQISFASSTQEENSSPCQVYVKLAAPLFLSHPPCSKKISLGTLLRIRLTFLSVLMLTWCQCTQPYQSRSDPSGWHSPSPLHLFFFLIRTVGYCDFIPKFP